MQPNILLKYLASFLKTDWSLEDYPIRMIHRESGPYDPRTLELVPWHVSIGNWPQMFGVGDTQAAALADLRQKLADYKQQHGSLPRPGTRVPLRFASSHEIERYEPLARDFFTRILGRSYDDVLFLSDQSSLWDFDPGEANKQCYVEKIRAAYQVDVSDIADGNFAQIFRRIHEQRQAGEDRTAI